MIRLALRQARLSAVTLGGLLVVLLAVLVWTEHGMTSYMHDSGLSACLTSRGDCALPMEDFTTRYGGWLFLATAVSFLPGVAGVFWGAPLIGREVEQGTHRLAWTQSISRERWLAVKLALYTLAGLAVAALLVLVFTWWFGPFARLAAVGKSTSRINPSFYNVQGIVLPAGMVFGFALGAASGALIRRTVPAIGVTIGGYLGVRLLLESWRPTLLPPLHLVHDMLGAQPRTGLGDWQLSNSPIDAAGRPVTFQSITQICGSLKDTGRTPYFTCAQAHGFRLEYTYQPLSRFWPLQGIESGILLGLAVLLLALAAWWTLRHTS